MVYTPLPKGKADSCAWNLAIKKSCLQKKAFLARIRTRKASDRQNWLLGIAKRLTPAL